MLWGHVGDLARVCADVVRVCAVWCYGVVLWDKFRLHCDLTHACYNN